MIAATQHEDRHILIVDDDPQILEIVSDYFRAHQFRVSIARDGEAMRNVMADNTVDLVILDLGLPKEDGIELTRRLRQQSDVGVIILTGREDDIDRVVSLELGADDYVTKPVPLRELLARARSVMRRTSQGPRFDSARNLRRARFAGIEIDLPSRQVTTSCGSDLHLTTAEFDLLAAFVAHGNDVLSRDRLLDMVYHRAAGPFDRSIDVLVGRLRRRLNAAAIEGVSISGTSLIKTVRGVGYVFTPRIEWLGDGS